MSAVAYVSQEMQATSDMCDLGFRREVDDNCVHLGYYTINSGISLPISGHLICPIFKSKLESRGCPETSLRNYHYSLHNSPEESSSQHLT